MRYKNILYIILCLCHYDIIWSRDAGAIRTGGRNAAVAQHVCMTSSISKEKKKTHNIIFRRNIFYFNALL